MSKRKVQESLLTAFPQQLFTIEVDESASVLVDGQEKTVKAIVVMWVDGPVEASVFAVANEGIEGWQIAVRRFYSVKQLASVLREVCQDSDIDVTSIPIKQSPNGVGFYIADKKTMLDDVLVKDAVKTRLSTRNFYIAPDKKILTTQVGEFKKGNKSFPMFYILNEKGENLLQFGVKKAEAILSFLEEIQKFVNDNKEAE